MSKEPTLSLERPAGNEAAAIADILPEERRQRLIELFATNTAVASQDLARMFQISVSTVRRDLEILASEGYVRRTHGGAVSIRRRASYEPSTALARATAVEEKAAIAREAVKLVEADQSLFIDTGSTCHVFADAVAAMQLPLTVITNDLYVANVFTYKDHVRLIVPGGTNRHGAFTLLGEPGLSFLEDVRCDRFFMSAQAVDGDCASDTAFELVQLKRAMLSSSEQTILLADSSRFNARAIYRISALGALHAVVTDEGLPDDEAERIAARGPRLVRAKLQVRDTG